MLLKTAVSGQLGQIEALSRVPAVSAQDQHRTGQAGPAGKLHIRRLIPDHETLLREQPMSFPQLIPQAGSGLPAEAPILRGMRTEHMISKIHPLRSQEILESCMHTGILRSRQKPPSDTGLIGNQKQSAAKIQQGSEGRADPWIQADPAGVGEIPPILDQRPIPIQQDIHVTDPYRALYSTRKFWKFF
jgi:hypothetical protein